MDNTELHYVTYDPDEIWNEMIYNYVQAGGDVLYAGDEKEMLLRSVQADIVQVLAGVDNALRMQTLRYAVGDYLDVIGENRNCPRLKATGASIELIIRSATEQTIPATNLLTTDGKLFWQMNNDVYISEGHAIVTATCTTVGTVGNGITTDTEFKFATAPEGTVTVFPYASTSGGGREDETDEEYRERIRTWMGTSSTAGPKKQYETLAKTTSGATITDALATNVNPETGLEQEGHVYVFIMGESDVATETEQGLVLQRIMADDVKPLTDTVHVKSSDRLAYVIRGVVTYNGSAAVAEDLNEAIEEYKQWQHFKIGRPFHPDKLKAMLFQAGALKVQFANCEFETSSGTMTRTNSPILTPVYTVGEHWYGEVDLTLQKGALE